MATQKGSFRVTGRVGDMIYYYNKLAGRVIGRRVPEKFGETVKVTPPFKPFRTQASINGLASSSCCILRRSLGDAIKDISDNKMNTRLLDPGRKAIRAAGSGDVHPFHTKAINAFRFFKFNNRGDLALHILSSFKGRIEGSKHITSFGAPRVRSLYYASHYQIISFVVGIDFANNVYEGCSAASKKLKFETETEPFDLEVEIPEGYPSYFNVLAIRQYELEAKRYVLFNNSKGHAADIMDVWLGE